jgi:hypothetical protein
MSADPHDGQKKRHLSSPETEARDYLAHCHVTPKSSACSSVGGAVPTSPPLRQKECPQDESSHRGCATCEGAGVIYVIDWQLEGAAPTSTPLDALIARWRELAQRAWGWADEAEKQNDGANAHAFRKERRIWNTCAHELEKRLAASPASALVTGENK